MSNYKFRIRWRKQNGEEYTEFQTATVDRVVYRVAHTYFYGVHARDDDSALLEFAPLEFPYMVRVSPEHVEAATETLTQQNLSSTRDYLFTLFRTRDYLFWFKNPDDAIMLKVFYGTPPNWTE